MTHEYTLLVGAVILPGGAAPPCEAMAWASGTVLALGTEAAIRALSRGDSHEMDLAGAFVVPAEAPLEVGSDADLLVLDRDPRAGPPGAVRAELRGGHVVRGSVERPAG